MTQKRPNLFGRSVVYKRIFVLIRGVRGSSAFSPLSGIFVKGVGMELSLFEELGKACGIAIEADDGQCTLLFDGRHEITLEQDGRACIFYGTVGKDICLANPENARNLLAGSFLGAETDGGALSLWKQAGEIVLWKRYDFFADYTDFENAVNAFLAQVIHWKGKIEEMPLAETVSESIPAGIKV